MNIKFFRKVVSAVLAFMMLVVCIPSVFATTASNDNLSDNIESGAVLVSLKSGSASRISEILKEFEIESIRLITPGSSTMAVYYVKFVEKSHEIVRKAITVLNESSCVDIAEPNYIGQYLPIIEPPVDDQTETTVDDQTEAIMVIESPVEIVKGDADGDGRVTICDATMIQRYIVRICQMDDFNIAASDFDGDGRVTICDATMIQRKLAGLSIEW